MIIEQLSFTMPSDHLDRWLAVDAAVWNPILAAQPGYQGKEVWITDSEPGDAGIVEVHVIVRWTSRALWKAVDPALLHSTHEAMGEHALTCRETVHVTPDDPERDRARTADATA